MDEDAIIGAVGFVIGILIFGFIGYSGKGVPRFLFGLGKEKAQALDHQLHGFQGYCRGLFGVGLVGGGAMVVFSLIEVVLRKI